MSAPRVLLVCCGLEHAHRGYETFARGCYEALRDEPGLDLELVKGSGPRRSGERSIPTLRRDRPVALLAGRALRARPFRIEAFAFGLALEPVLARRRPELVYVSEWDTARVLAFLRSRLRQRFKLLFCNGGFATYGFECFDHVQELTPFGRQWVLDLGADPRRHSVLPMGFELAAQAAPSSATERTRLRRELRLPVDRRLIVSIAALNREQKRLDYLIEEFAALPEPRPFLLLDGQPEEETAGLRALARERLGPDGCELRTSPSDRVPDVLRASDAFVLASLAETQARAVIEAAAEFVPCLVHESPITRFALGDHGWFADLTRTGSLTELLLELARTPAAVTAQRVDHAREHVYERFSWDRLRPRYVELLTAVANSTVSSPVAVNVSR